MYIHKIWIYYKVDFVEEEHRIEIKIACSDNDQNEALRLAMLSFPMAIGEWYYNHSEVQKAVHKGASYMPYLRINENKGVQTVFAKSEVASECW